MQRDCGVLRKGHVETTVGVVVVIGKVDARWRSSQDKAEREWGRADRVDVGGRKESAVATMRTIGSGSKGTTPIPIPRAYLVL